MTDLSVIIVSSSTRELLTQCLRSVQKDVEGLDGYRAETFVVDNASTDGSAMMVRERFPWVRLIENPTNVGFARANNQAMRLARGRYHLLLNSDTRILPGTLGELLGFADSHPRAGVLGAKLINPDGSFQASYNDFPSIWKELVSAAGLGRRFYGGYYPSYAPKKNQAPVRVDWVPGACIMVRRQAVDEVGMLDERFVMYTEETDWCYRMKRAGWDVYHVPRGVTVHYGGGSASRYAPQQLKLLYRSKAFFFNEHHGALEAQVYVGGVRVATLAKIAVWGISLLFAGGSKRRLMRVKLSSHWEFLKTWQGLRWSQVA